MDTQIYFEMVENFFKKIPKKYTKNYYANKETLTIINETISVESFIGQYINKTNTIYISDLKALPHELFHMSFRDENKIDKPLYNYNDMTIYYDNGISVKIKTKNDEEKYNIYNKGLTEGFAEYLSRKCSNFKGQSLNHFFTELLILIYGEEIIKYPLSNDPIGFFEDKRFKNIKDISLNIDSLDFYKNIFLIMGDKKIITKILNSNNKEELNEFESIINQACSKFLTSILSLFKLIIAEYQSCKKPKISREEFLEKMYLFLTDEDYKFVHVLLQNYDVENKIKEIIVKFQKQSKHKKLSKILN